MSLCSGRQIFDARPLRFANTDPGRGSVGAALGYPGGGPLMIVPAAVTGSYRATGRDIYDEARVDRDILELRAQIDRGDSGGPFVLQDGTIGGLVFAEARSDPDVGYALSPRPSRCASRRPSADARSWRPATASADPAVGGGALRD